MSIKALALSVFAASAITHSLCAAPAWNAAVAPAASVQDPYAGCQLPVERRGNTDWFSQAGWGVFVHYLHTVQNTPGRPVSMGKSTDWETCVNEFDTEKFAEQAKQTGAKYVIFTVMQLSRYMIAPNATYDKLTGFKPGEACSKRDLIEDLYQSLNKRGIKLMLYWTGDGPAKDPQAIKGLGGSLQGGQVPLQFVKNWAAVAAEYGERYKGKVLGWWTDGCYRGIGYNEEKWMILANGLRAGNPKRIIALNNPDCKVASSSTLNDDYTTGEVNRLGDTPSSRWRNGVQWHVLGYLGKDTHGPGTGWCSPGLLYTPECLGNYIRRCNRAGGVVSIDICVYRDGSIDAEHIKCLRLAGELALKNIKPTPAGNLATDKPCRLLKNDGSRELPPCLERIADNAVDCTADTIAQAGGEYAWTLEADLLKVESLSRIAVTFGKTEYATQYRIALSADGKNWTSVAEKNDHDGAKVSCEFAPTSARYVRVTALKPDAAEQPGGQMQIAELEVYSANTAQ